MTDIDKMNGEKLTDAVNRFLAWKLPATFAPADWDKGWPRGRHLLTAEAARVMFKHCFALADEEPERTPLQHRDGCDI